MPTGGVGWTGWLSAIWYALAGVASGSADSGNPVKIGGVYNTLGLAALTAGQRGDAQLDNNGNLYTRLIGTAVTGVDAVPNSLIYGTDTARNTNRPVAVAQHKFNGATWDRNRKPNATKILPSAAASTNSDFAKASAGDLWCISGFNAAASVRYLKVFNKASAPTVGTDTPVMVIALPVGAFNLNLGGHYLGTGIAFALTTGAALLDTGALTAADIVGLTLTYA
ncbi:hypothetical protein [Mesorhizobium sp. B2-3-4]|uniref:hypothetical protein n=1 Tax=Mesorhizobium sp. B2-3-4 TaxID=2589959 RepID=UPI00112C4863|nr:hypothetical protein [Mesorhizobium sp. B2-3-4]TPM25705.1 hypothetical protein FJ967_32285 [Mesorhizobium sp. B2-3-4]